MGYMEISISGSDAAADLNAEVEKQLDAINLKAALGLLYAEIETNHGPWNTHGCMNVAMVLTESDTNWTTLIKNYTGFKDAFREVLCKVTGELAALRGRFSRGTWDSKENKLMHLRRCDELGMKLLKLLEENK